MTTILHHLARIRLSGWGSILFGGIFLLWPLPYLLTHEPLWEIAQAMEARAEVGKPPTLNQLGAYGLWGSHFLIAGALLLAALTTRFWLPHKVLLWRGYIAQNRKFTNVIVFVIILLAVAPRLTRLDHSLWTDEEWALSLYTWGEFKENSQATLEFSEHSWKTTLWKNKDSNNHILYSVLQRLSLSSWRAWRGISEPYAFSEWAARFPAFIAGLLALLALALFTQRLATPTAGALAALFLCWHPWHLRYSSEARGYSLVILLSILVLWGAALALDRGKWRYWLALGACQFLLLATFAGAAYFLVVLQTALLASFCWSSLPGPIRVQMLWRWFWTNTASACAYLLLAWPALIQLATYLKISKRALWHMDLPWLERIGSYFTFGMTWRRENASNPVQMSADQLPGFPWLPWAALAVLGIALAIGLLLMARRHPSHAFILASPILGALLSLGHSLFQGRGILSFYLIYALPAAIFLASIGLVHLGNQARMVWGGPRLIATLPALLAFALFATVTWRQNIQLVLFPIEQQRRAAQITRGSVESLDHLGPSRVVTASLWRTWRLYDWRIQSRTPWRQRENIVAAMHECARQGKELFYTIGNPPLARQLNADVFTLLRDERYFEPLEVLWGHDESFTLWPYRFRLENYLTPKGISELQKLAISRDPR